MSIEQARGTGKWRDPAVPHKGWECASVEDLGEPSAVCEMCEVMEIRYVHYMAHPDYPDELACGCVCAEHMEGDYRRPREREKALRNAAQRRKRWLTRAWNVSAKGNPFLRTDGYVITVFRKHGAWSASIHDSRTEKTLFARRLYNTQDAAKLAAFDAMIFLKHQQVPGSHG